MRYRFGPSEKLDFADHLYTPNTRPPDFPEVLIYTEKYQIYAHDFDALCRGERLLRVIDR